MLPLFVGKDPLHLTSLLGRLQLNLESKQDVLDYLVRAA